MLGCVVAEELFARFPKLSEGKLTRLRASLVREETLAELAGSLGLGPLVRLGEGELAASEPRPSILADALEAVLGAVFLDGGYAVARQAVLAMLGRHIDGLDPERPAKDAKTQLQEMLQAARKPLPEYRVVGVRGAPHRQSFEVECAIAGGLTARGSGSSRQRAEQEAAAAMLEKLA